ncbi:MAG TPA: DUF6084 family protein [Acetobacteraceae bacterium]
MIDLDFAVEDMRAEQFTASPLLMCALRVTNNTPDIPIRNVMLRCQIRIEPTRRHYAAREHEKLSELFGLQERWGETLRSFLWTHTDALIPAFDTDCVIDLPVPCSYDFNIAATTYFHGIEDGEVPLSLLFSGTIFYGDPLQIEQIAWSNEASYRLPVAVWHDMMAHHYPNGLFLCLGKEVFDRLQSYKRAHGHPTMERALTALLP